MSKRLEMIEKMIAQGSEDPFVWYARAMELRSLNRLDEALQQYADVRRKFPDYVPTYLMAGQVCEQLGDQDAAREWLRAGVECATKERDAHAASELRAALVALNNE